MPKSRPRKPEYYQRYKPSLDQRRRERMMALIGMLGGECSVCGYSRCIDALDFHHVDPSTKQFGLGSSLTRSWADVVLEANKCVLLCANCHRERHAAERKGWVKFE